jgi:hypothetical protein
VAGAALAAAVGGGGAGRDRVHDADQRVIGVKRDFCRFASGRNVGAWWEADWQLAGTRGAMADIARLPPFPKRIRIC